VRAGLPKGVEQLLFQMLEKAPEDRPYLAQDVVERLEPFQTAAAPSPRVSRTSRTDAGVASPRSPRSTEAERATAPRASRNPETAREAMSQEEPDPSRAKTKESEPFVGKEPPPRADTIALVDKVDRKREVPTALAVGIIVALSLLAGLGAYLLRSTSGPAETPPGPTASGPVFPVPPRSGGTRR
jgi:serine/threonine-protein kinase